MEEIVNFIKKWLFDPTTDKLVIIIGLVLISVLVMVLKCLITRYIKDGANKYRVAKSLNTLGYFFIHYSKSI